jgi:hypothetical protein
MHSPQGISTSPGKATLVHATETSEWLNVLVSVLSTTSVAAGQYACSKSKNGFQVSAKLSVLFTKTVYAGDSVSGVSSGILMMQVYNPS